MKVKVRNDRFLVESRFFLASIFIFLVCGSLLLRLWYVQVFRGEYYRSYSDRNRVKQVEISVPRGIIYDRNGEVVLGNRPFFDLVYIPQYGKDTDTTFRALSSLLQVPVSRFEKKLRRFRGRPKFLPIILKRNLTLHEVSIVDNNRIFLQGIEVRVEARRDYRSELPVHLLGYLRDVDPKTLQKNSELYEDNPYVSGDLIGRQGLESRWEPYLRGRRGYRVIQVDAFGRKAKEFEGKSLDYSVKDAIPGSDLELTLDLELQKEVKKAFSGKNGAVVVLDPRNGRILAALSEPGFDPELMQSGLSRSEFRELTSNPYRPFLDKTTGGAFPPGSVFKPVVALAGLEEGKINMSTKVNCTGSFTLGNHTFYCHNRHGHGLVNLKHAMMKSCDVYFYQLGVELGVDTIARYAKSLGLGEKLGVRLNMERPGLIPTSSWKQSVYRFPWTIGDTPNVAIGQGYVLVTPMQIASLYSSIANSGHVYRPYIVKQVTNHVGKVEFTQEADELKASSIISPANFKLMRSILASVVMDSEGTGFNAQVPGHSVAGKTGSVQVVSLKKNRNQTDVSMRWKEHAIFAAFSPVEGAEVAVAVVSQNDNVGGGGKAAAPVAQKILAKYWSLKARRKSEERRRISVRKRRSSDVSLQ